MFAEPDPLPGAEGDAAITDGEGQVAAQQTRLRVGGHVVRALAAVLPRDRLRHQPAVRDSIETLRQLHRQTSPRQC